MNANKIAIESLSMDLLRVALGYHKGSTKMAERFSQEALNRIDEIQITDVKPYFAKILNKLPNALSGKDKHEVAEDALMYSVLCRNYAKKFT
jgi:hypothetical protein